MREDELDRLRYRRESETIDFKEGQYLLETDAQKAELVKDVLAFANAWRKERAYILRGVREEAAGPATVVGIDAGAHIPDSNIQQLVNSKTNKPIAFRYVPLEHHGKHIGVIEIDPTDGRPYFLRKGFGSLKAGAVYVRRGSSTDVAMPDEIALMGKSQLLEFEQPTLGLELIDIVMRHRVGSDAVARSVFLVDPPRPQQTPRATPTPQTLPPGLRSAIGEIAMGVPRSLAGTLLNPTEEQMRAWEKAAALCYPLGLWVKNSGRVTATDVRVELTIPEAPGLRVLDPSGFPEKPGEINVGKHLRHAINCQQHGDGWLLEARFGKVQPQQEMEVSDCFYVEARETAVLLCKARVFADNLPEPREFDLTIRTEPEEHEHRHKQGDPQRGQ